MSGLDVHGAGTPTGRSAQGKTAERTRALVELIDDRQARRPEPSDSKSSEDRDGLLGLNPHMAMGFGLIPVPREGDAVAALTTSKLCKLTMVVADDRDATLPVLLLLVDLIMRMLITSKLIPDFHLPHHRSSLPSSFTINAWRGRSTNLD